MEADVGTVGGYDWASGAHDRPSWLSEYVPRSNHTLDGVVANISDVLDLLVHANRARSIRPRSIGPVLPVLDPNIDLVLHGWDVESRRNM